MQYKLNEGCEELHGLSDLEHQVKLVPWCKSFALELVSMNGESQPTGSCRWTGWVRAITGWSSSRHQEMYCRFHGNIARINEGKPNDRNVSLVGLGNTRILTDYAQKPPWTLIVPKFWVVQLSYCDPEIERFNTQMNVMKHLHLQMKVHPP